MKFQEISLLLDTWIFIIYVGKQMLSKAEAELARRVWLSVEPSDYGAGNTSVMGTQCHCPHQGECFSFN